MNSYHALGMTNQPTDYRTVSMSTLHGNGCAAVVIHSVLVTPGLSTAVHLKGIPQNGNAECGIA